MIVRVDSRLRCERPPAELADALRLEFTRVNPQHMKLKSMGFRAWKEPYHLKSWRDEAGGVLSLPRGGAADLSRLAREHGEPLVFVDERTRGERAAVPELRLEPRRYQLDIADKIAEKENLLVRAGAGSGKTTAALLFVSRVKVPTLIIVKSDALKKQWVERIEREFGIPARDVGVVQGRRFDLRPVTVGMAQTLAGLAGSWWRKLNDYFGVVVQDEVQSAAANTFNAVVDRCRAKYRIGISDSERRKDGKHFLIYEQFGRVEYEIEHEDLVDAGFVLDVAVRVHECVTTDVDWYRQAYEREVADDAKPAPADAQAFNRLMEQLTRDEERNRMIAAVAARAAKEGPAIVFSHRVEHCRVLDSLLTGAGLRCGLLVGGKGNEAEFERAARGLRSGALRVGVGTVQAVGTGIDIPEASRAVVATPLAANKQLWRQVRGRINRPSPGKSDAVAYYLHDPRAFGDRPLKNLRAWNRSVEVFGGGGWVEVSDYLRGAGPVPFLSEAR